MSNKVADTFINSFIQGVGRKKVGGSQKLLPNSLI